MTSAMKRKGLTTKLFEAYDGDGTGAIELEEFQELVVSDKKMNYTIHAH